MTRAFLPLLRRSDDARIVNVSSIFGLVAPPGQSAYCASKFAVRGFSNALRHELEGTRIGVTVVHPGGVATSIARSARAPAGAAAEEIALRRAASEKLLRMPPERAGEIIVRAVERRRARVLVGGDAVVVALIERLAPVRYWRLLGRCCRADGFARRRSCRHPRWPPRRRGGDRSAVATSARAAHHPVRRPLAERRAVGAPGGVRALQHRLDRRAQPLAVERVDVERGLALALEVGRQRRE